MGSGLRHRGPRLRDDHLTALDIWMTAVERVRRGSAGVVGQGEMKRITTVCVLESVGTRNSFQERVYNLDSSHAWYWRETITGTS